MNATKGFGYKIKRTEINFEYLRTFLVFFLLLRVESCKHCSLHNCFTECRLFRIEVAICQTTGVL